MAESHTVEEWLDFAASVSIPASPVLDLGDMHDDPQVLSSDLMPIGEHPTEGSYRMVNDSVRFEASPTAIRRHAPSLGQHTREILAEIGWESDRIDACLAAGAAAEGERP